MLKIRKVAVIGANGTMGSLSGGIFAQSDIHCLFFARSLEKAQRGIENAVKQARSYVLRDYLKPLTYEDIPGELPKCDWILEGVAEDMELKQMYFQLVDTYRKKGSIVSTLSSCLSIEKMAEGQSADFKEHFLGTHFFNPPSRLPANELIFHPLNTHELRKAVRDFCEKRLSRVNIVAFNTPGFAGNRIGFQFLNEAAILSEKYGVEKVDSLLGPYTGRVMPPLATLDLVGLDVYRAILRYIYETVEDERYASYRMPLFVQKMIDLGILGKKGVPPGGFYRQNEGGKRLVLDLGTFEYRPVENTQIGFVEKAKQYIHDGNYRQAVKLIKTEQSEEACLVRHFILGYISYSFFRVGEVTPTEDGIHGIDRVMSYGFSWLPPSGWVDLLGGPSETVALMKKEDIPVPEHLRSLPEGRRCRIPEITKYLIAY